MVKTQTQDAVYKSVVEDEFPSYLREFAGYLGMVLLGSGAASAIETYIPGSAELADMFRGVAISSLMMTSIVRREVDDNFNRRSALAKIADSNLYDSELAKDVLDELYSPESETNLTPYGARLFERRLIGRRQRRIEDAMDSRTYVGLTRLFSIVAQTAEISTFVAHTVI